MIPTFLKSPYPANYGQSENLKIGLYIGAFVALFLFIFKPFGIDNATPSLWHFASYGLITFLGIAIAHYICPKLFPSFFEEKNYTLGKDLLLSIFLITTIGLGNALYNHAFISSMSMSGIVKMIFNTFLVGIFPLTFLSLLEYNRQLKRNLQTSSEIKLPDHTLETPGPTQLTEANYQLSGEDSHANIPLQHLLYIESVGNYANVVNLIEDNLSRNLYRTTLKALEEENNHPKVIRCHRSYIVNLDQVIEVKGNAQGLKLHLKNCNEIIPVSRKYIPVVKSSFRG